MSDTEPQSETRGQSQRHRSSFTAGLKLYKGVKVLFRLLDTGSDILVGQSKHQSVGGGLYTLYSKTRTTCQQRMKDSSDTDE